MSSQPVQSAIERLSAHLMLLRSLYKRMIDSEYEFEQVKTVQQQIRLYERSRRLLQQSSTNSERVSLFRKRLEDFNRKLMRYEQGRNEA